MTALPPLQLAVQRIEAAFAAGGYSLLESDKAAIEGAADGLADEWLDKAVTAFADNLSAHGITGSFIPPVKAALINSEPQFDQATNDQIDKLYSALEQVTSNAAASLSGAAPGQAPLG